eukprot:TRINITY_DN9055_c0_g1_i4.p2 TRINITY_DN9055_c0_g1~~TRINITY_DN9055_c0_g1_i4.p2  ORF type:complete len:105 (+),score=1.00 TRINITY_DN9055_c0_g1_i4:89-403(+)
MIRRPPRSTLSSSSAASDVYKRQHTRSLVVSTCHHTTPPQLLPLHLLPLPMRPRTGSTRYLRVVVVTYPRVSFAGNIAQLFKNCLLYTSPSPRDRTRSRMPSSA